MTPPDDSEPGLLRHTASLRALALALLRDPAAAEDAVQDAYVDALRRRGAVRSPGGWLRAAVRGFALQRRRRDARRLLRERAVAKPEAVPAAGAMAARREQMHRLVDAVYGLDEPYRSAIWQRYFEELPPSAIA